MRQMSLSCSYKCPQTHTTLQNSLTQRFLPCCWVPLPWYINPLSDSSLFQQFPCPFPLLGGASVPFVSGYSPAVRDFLSWNPVQTPLNTAHCAILLSVFFLINPKIWNPWTHNWGYICFPYRLLFFLELLAPPPPVSCTAPHTSL